MLFYKGQAEYFLVKDKKVKALQIGSIQHVSRSGEKGRTASFWLVGESRLLYVRTKESMQMVSFCSLKGNLEGFRSDVWLSHSCMIELC